MMVAAFVEERLDVGYDFGEVGGPAFQTDIIEFGSGHEVRNGVWQDARGSWELGERNITRDRLEELTAFFRARRGKLQGFRFKDWQDFRASDEEVETDGTPTVQLRKTYTSAGVDQVREITKPVGGTVTMQRDGADYTFTSVDTTTGVVTLSVDQSASITDVTAAAPAVVTATDHGISDGVVVYITNTGLSEIDDQAWTITRIDADTFELDGSDTSGTGGSSTGLAEKFVQPGETLTWSGEFDVPVRFDTDEFRARFEAATENAAIAVYFLSSLPVIELR